MKRRTLQHINLLTSFAKLPTYIFICVVVLFLTSCSSTRKLPDGEQLYTGATIKIEQKDYPVAKKKLLKAELEAITTPKPNSSLLGIRTNSFSTT